MVGLPVQLSQSEASSLSSWRSIARTELALASVSFLTGASAEGAGAENKNKFEKLKANRSQSKERKFVPNCRRKNLLGVFAMTTWASTSGNLKQFLHLLFLLREGLGARGEGGIPTSSSSSRRGRAHLVVAGNKEKQRKLPSPLSLLSSFECARCRRWRSRPARSLV